MIAAWANIPQDGGWLTVGTRDEGRSMSLKTRLLALFGLFAALILGGGGAVMIGNARDAVRAEMRSALALGVALAQEGGAVAGDAAVLGGLGLRHLRFSSGADPLSHHSSAQRDAPDWFVAVIGVEPQERRVGALRVIAEPWDEIAEVWEDLSDLAIAILGLTALLLAAAALAVDRALRPLAALERGVERLRSGGFDLRFDGGGVPELRRLGDGIAALAVSLERAEQENRRLGRQLVTAQDDERREIAREIHDELGAALFGVKVDAGGIVRLAENAEPGTGLADAGERARSILATADGVQRMSRRILTRLRPVSLDHLPLTEALAELVGDWTRRQPAIRWSLTLPPDAADLNGLDEALRLTLYRLVQEALVNALRHAQPTALSVAVERAGGALVVCVADDGAGVSEERGGESGGGLGLSGMAERVQALGGRLTVGPASGSRASGAVGTRVRAVLPLDAAPVHSSERLAERLERARP